MGQDLCCLDESLTVLRLWLLLQRILVGVLTLLLLLLMLLYNHQKLRKVFLLQAWLHRLLIVVLLVCTKGLVFKEIEESVHEERSQ